MSIHIGAKKGDIAETVLLPGDPLRARYIAGHFLRDSVCYNEVRAMYGYTGMYKDRPISVQSTGMGGPSCAIYVEELIQQYGCKNLIRVGTCGSIQDDLPVGEVILAMGACTDSNMNRIVFEGLNFAPVAHFELLHNAFEHAKTMGIPVRVGNVMTSDTFYNVRKDFYAVWKAHGVLAYEMETAALYTIAARHNARALSILTVSDSLLNGEGLTSKERETAAGKMVEIALNAV